MALRFAVHACLFSVHRMALAGKELAAVWAETAAGAIKSMVQSFADASLAISVAQLTIKSSKQTYIPITSAHSISSFPQAIKMGEHKVVVLIGIWLGIYGVTRSIKRQ
ncbi:hypothetical protein EI94DRAFT_1699154 [Lactarius quietus]|nr:hypothetical protein EI94DRAFT_1699154 [Lactarius quietus]